MISLLLRFTHLYVFYHLFSGNIGSLLLFYPGGAEDWLEEDRTSGNVRAWGGEVAGIGKA